MKKVCDLSIGSACKTPNLLFFGDLNRVKPTFLIYFLDLLSEKSKPKRSVIYFFDKK